MTQAAVSDKRRYPRKERLNGLSVAWHNGGQRYISSVYDLSLGGAFIQSQEPPPEGTTLKLLFRVCGKVARARAIVRRSVPGRGMGIEFVAMEQEDRACLAVAAESADELVPVADEQPEAAPIPETPYFSEPPAPQRRVKGIGVPVRDRRARSRHKFTAQVEVTEADSGNSISAGLGDISGGGCFIETDQPLPLGTTVTVSIVKGSELFQSNGRVVNAIPQKGMGVMFIGTELEYLRVLGSWILESSWLAADRRKSQRIVLSVPIRIVGKNAQGAAFSENTQTLKISADGCSLLLAASVTKGQSITLINCRTKAMVECMVVRVEPSPDGQAEIGVSFLLPNRKFWRVTFPKSGSSSSTSEPGVLSLSEALRMSGRPNLNLVGSRT